MTTLVVAVGNPDRGDDAAGWLVADLLDGRDVVTVRRVRGDLVALLDDPAWAQAEHVVVVDATCSGRPVGTITRWTADEVLDGAAGIGAGAHDLGLATMLGLARALARLPASLVVVGVEGADFTPGRSASDAVRAAAATVAATVLPPSAGPGQVRGVSDSRRNDACSW